MSVGLLVSLYCIHCTTIYLHEAPTEWRSLMRCVEFAEAKHFAPIHREAPSFQEQGTEQEILITGIKVCLTQLISTSVLLKATLHV